MTPAEWNQVKELFQTALDLDPSQRVAFLAENCHDDQIRREVEALLRNYEEAGSFLSDPVMNRLWEAHTTEESPDSKVDSAVLTTDTNNEVIEPMTGRRLGAYKVVRRIGQGGMAAVFLATRADDEYEKQVAIKLLQPGFDSRELLSRFRNERQTLADLDHPNIVKLLDGGRTHEGSPFLVMDYVDGSPIDDYCDGHKLCVDDRLRLFSKVCEAVQYAHQKSIVHRDLKPSNILVTDDGAPKVLDFGIAKVLSPQSSAQTLPLTRTRTRCMTPAYASPEQMRGKSITTATDIYSLGVVLYELLSGHRPYRLKENTPVEIERAICEQEPEPPSTAVNRVETDITFSGVPVTKTPELVSETREGPPEKLRRHLRGDIDNIVLKALQKEPARRYASVDDFSQDITRHLQHLPVKARRHTLTYRTSKFVRRHKRPLSAVFLPLIVVAAAATWTARSHLTALSGNGATNTTEMRTRRVWAGPDVDTSGVASSNGAYLTFVDWETGDLAIRDLRTGEKRRLTNKGSWSASHEFALSSVPSPDSKQVAYDWLNKDFRWDLRVVGLDGSTPRILHSNKEMEQSNPVDWSPDGKYILARFLMSDRTFQIVLVSAADGTVRVLKKLDWRYPGKMCFSPDGRYIAYDLPPEQDSPNRDIFLLSSDGSREVPLVQHPADDSLLGWTPDGTTILFASDRTGNMSVWSVRVANGKAQEAPELIKADAGPIAALGLTRKGALYYGVRIGRQDVYVATLDVATGKVLAAPSPLTQRYIGSNFSPFWSQDGRYVAFTSERQPGSRVVVIRSMENGKERELAPNLDDFDMGPWSPDGRSILLRGTDRTGHHGAFRIDVGSAALAPVALAETGADAYSPKWSPDGKAVFFRRGATDTKGSSVAVRDVQTGREKELYRAGSSSYIEPNVEVSPDGRQVAISVLSPKQPELLLMIPTSGGEARKLLEVHQPELIKSIAWTPDARYILFAEGRALTGDSKNQLWRIPAEGGEPEKLALEMDWLSGVRFHPDGRHIAFTAGQNKFEVWVMENFLPLIRAAK